jgi:hypothetical protein
LYYVYSYTLPSFDADSIVVKTLKNRKWKTDPTYSIISKEQGAILKSWDENRDQAATAGFHAFSIETFYNGVEVHNDSVNTAAFRFRAATTPI